MNIFSAPPFWFGLPVRVEMAMESVVQLMGRSEWKSGRYMKAVHDGVLKYYLECWSIWSVKSWCTQSAETLFLGVFSSTARENVM